MEKEEMFNDELVLAKSSLSASRAEINALARRVSELEELNTRLREHILLRDSFERNMDKEYKMQLSQKDEVVRRLALLSAKKEGESAALAAPKPESAQPLVPVATATSEEEMKELLRLSEQLKEHLNEKDAVIQRLKEFVSESEELSQKVEEQLQKKLAEKEEELSSLKRAGSTKIRRTAAEHRELEQARHEIKLKEAEGRRTILELAGLKETRAILERKLKDSEQHLQGLKTENDNLKFHLRNKSQAMSEEEGLRQAEEARQLTKKLHDKETEIRHLTHYYADKEQAYEAIQSQLSDRLKEKNRETERLKSFLAEMEELSQKVEEQLQKEIAAKDSELMELRHTKSHGKALALQRQLEHTAQIIKLKDAANKKLLLELISSKETGSIASRKLKDEQTHSESLKAQYELIIGTIKKDNERIMKGLIEDYNARVAAAKTETERIRAELSSKESALQVQKQRIDEAIKEFGIRAQQVISMRQSIEPIEKAATQIATQSAAQVATQAAQIPQQASQQASQTQAHDSAQQIPERIETTTKEELEQYAKKAKMLREALYKKDRELTKREAEMKQKEGELLSRETELKAMISTTEQRLKELERREDSGDRKEQILLKQQEAFNRELQALEAAGSRLITVESELESQLKALPAQATVPAPYSHPPTISAISSAAREAPQQPERIAVLEPAQQKIVRTEEIKPEKPTLQKPEQKPKKPESATSPKALVQAIKSLEKPVSELTINLEEQTLGYSEVEEIMSMIDVAMQHKESIEQIKNSLLSSGYTKENVEKAMKRMNL